MGIGANLHCSVDYANYMRLVPRVEVKTADWVDSVLRIHVYAKLVLPSPASSMRQ